MKAFSAICAVDIVSVLRSYCYVPVLQLKRYKWCPELASRASKPRRSWFGGVALLCAPVAHSGPLWRATNSSLLASPQRRCGRRIRPFGTAAAGRASLQSSSHRTFGIDTLV
jgi:hypothetical protein